MIDHIPEMINSGIASLKIEGRLKGINYLASAVKTYREAIDACYESPGSYHIKSHWKQELAQINQRGYCTGFYLKDASQIVPNYANDTPREQSLFVGKITDIIDSNWVKIDIRNKLQQGDTIEILPAKGRAVSTRIAAIIAESGKPAAFVHPEAIALIRLESQVACSPTDIVRKTCDTCQPARNEPS